MSIKRVFKNTERSSSFIFKNGKSAVFTQGEYYTDDENEIAELEAEIKAGHTYIYIDENKKEVDVSKLDPLHEIRAAAIEEYKKSLLAATDPENDMGKVGTAALLQGIVSSSDQKVISSGSLSGATPAAKGK